MLIDASLNFVPPGSPLSLAGISAATPSTNVIDLLGSGVGTPPANIIGNASVFGMDVGIGQIKPLLAVIIGTAFTTGGSPTLTIAFQGAQDTGVGGGYAPGTWQTFIQSAAMTAAQLLAGVTVARFEFPPAMPANFSPRYLRLLFTPSTSFTTGTIGSAVVSMGRDDQANAFAARNYAVA